MKNQFIKIYFFAVTLIIVTSCSEDFLDVDSKDRIEQEDSDVVTPEMMVNGVYGKLTDWDYAFSYLGITEIISDNADKGSSPSDTGADKDLLDNLEHSSTSGSIDDMWTNWYSAINRATTSIDYTQNYGLTDNDYKNRLIGEAKFLRALNYFWLVRSFGDVPLQHVDFTTRAPKEDVYEFIEQDLLDAIDVLPLKSEYDAADLGRATKGAAQGLLAKVYLYEEKWQQAFDMTTNIINSGEYDLYPNYAELWRASQENGIESLFEVQARGETIGPRSSTILTNPRCQRYHWLGLGI